MPSDNRDERNTPKRAPAKTPETREDPTDRDDGAGWPTRHGGDERGDRGDRMPKGADEPGAGL